MQTLLATPILGFSLTNPTSTPRAPYRTEPPAPLSLHNLQSPIAKTPLPIPLPLAASQSCKNNPLWRHTTNTTVKHYFLRETLLRHSPQSPTNTPCSHPNPLSGGSLNTPIPYQDSRFKIQDFYCHDNQSITNSLNNGQTINSFMTTYRLRPLRPMCLLVNFTFNLLQ